MLIRSIGTDSNRLAHTGTLWYDPNQPRIPSAALSAPDADLLASILASGAAVRVRITVACENRANGESANVIGEIVGHEKPGEIVLLGAHLDSWDLGRGALDDAAGCGVVIEAARQIAQLPARPRRTIRVVLYANEENGQSGSEAYASTHATELEFHAAALEMDSGTGRPTAFSWRAAPSTLPLLAQMTDLLRALSIAPSTEEGEFGADVANLLETGVPLLNLWQDLTTYFDYHHTANDTFDKIVPRDLDKVTAATAVIAWCMADAPSAIERVPQDHRKLE
jgi:Zn-dependent M28 family amino/carboxypeptidase